MNPFIITEVVENHELLNSVHFPLARSADLQDALARMFSTYLGCLQSGNRFESEILLVTGLSGSGKTKEIGHLVQRFNDYCTPIPEDRTASIVTVSLDRIGGWKNLGKATLKAMGYQLPSSSRLSQPEIWQRVLSQASGQGIVGIHFDEAQHIFMDRSEAEVGAILDSFKSLLKSREWPVMLIMSGVPELHHFIDKLDQVVRKITHVHFQDIDPANDLELLNEIVGSYAIKAGLSVSTDLLSGDFLHRLVVAGAYRWGLAIEITEKAIDCAKIAGGESLTRQHYVGMWTHKTKMHPAATPFTHAGYETVFRRDAPFKAFV